MVQRVAWRAACVAALGGWLAGWALPAPAQGAAVPAATKPAATAADGPSWQQLNASQRDILAPLARDWAGIDGARKAKWLEVAARYPKMQPDEQARMRERMAEWARMTPAERSRARLTFQETRQLSREEMQSRWEAYSALPEAERQALAERNRRHAERPRVAASSPALPIDVALPKQNKVPAQAASAPPVRPVAPTVVQAKPGATTLPMNKAPTPAVHQQPGQPKIAASPGQVDRATLLPRRGTQGPTAAAASSQPLGTPISPASSASPASPAASQP